MWIARQCSLKCSTMQRHIQGNRMWRRWNLDKILAQEVWDLWPKWSLWSFASTMGVSSPWLNYRELQFSMVGSRISLQVGPCPWWKPYRAVSLEKYRLNDCSLMWRSSSNPEKGSQDVTEILPSNHRHWNHWSRCFNMLIPIPVVSRVVLRQSRRHCCASLAAHTRHFGGRWFCVWHGSSDCGLWSQQSSVPHPYSCLGSFLLCPTGISYLYRAASCSTKVINYSESATVADRIQVSFVLPLYWAWGVGGSISPLWDADAVRCTGCTCAGSSSGQTRYQDGGRSSRGWDTDVPSLTCSPSPVSSRSTKRRLVSITRHWWETFQISPFKHVETDSPEVDSDFFTRRRRWFGLRLRRPGGLEWASSRLRFQFAFWCWQVSHSILSCVVSCCNLSLWIKEYRMILFQLNLRHLFRLNLPICFAGLPLFLLLINPCAFVSSLLRVFKISHAFSAAECCRLGTDGRLRLKLEMRCGQWLARKWPAWSSNLLSSAFHGTFAQEMWCAFCGEAIDEADENAGIAEDVRMGSMGDQWMAVTSGWGENDAKNVLVSEKPDGAPVAARTPWTYKVVNLLQIRQDGQLYCSWCWALSVSPRKWAQGCRTRYLRECLELQMDVLPVVPHKAVAEVSKIGNL